MAHVAPAETVRTSSEGILDSLSHFLMRTVMVMVDYAGLNSEMKDNSETACRSNSIS